MQSLMRDSGGHQDQGRHVQIWVKAMVKKPMRSPTNLWEIADELDKTCDGGHVHRRHLQTGGAKAAEVYPDEMCGGIPGGTDLQDLQCRVDQRSQEERRHS